MHYNGIMPERHAYLRRARHWLANRGARGLLEELWYRGRLLAKGKAIPGRENGKTVRHPFDVDYAVDTSGLIWGEALQQPSRDGAAYWATGYYGISPSAFTAALGRLQLDWSRFSFVDVGCGKGRAMLLALRFPFKQVIGVELSSALASTAERNLQVFQAPWRLPQVTTEVRRGDATTFLFPAGPLLVFLYHPFAAPVMRRFLDHMSQSFPDRKREVYLLYANPELEALLVERTGAIQLWKQTFALTPEEGAADRFGSHGEAISAFALH